MRNIRIEKVTLNIGCGSETEKVEKAKALLEFLTGKKVVITKSKTRSTFGVPKDKPIGAMVTLRGEEAAEFLKRALQGVENKIKASQFDNEGNFSFGVKEYIDMPDVKYQHGIGMFGFDVSVTLDRAGHRIKRRRIQKRSIPTRQKITKDEAAEWLKKNFGVDIIG
jgi:large subunit ribosomal protein L5